MDQSGADAIDVEELLRNWARYVRWGSTGLPRHRDVCVSYEYHYATHNSRFQYEGPPPRAQEPRFAEGHRVEKIITNLDEFPAVWRRVLIVEYLKSQYLPRTVDPDEFLQSKANLARMTPRSYEEFLSAARSHIRMAYYLRHVAAQAHEP